MPDQDRRVRRTRRILHEALIGLILEKGYERITVQDVLDRADVGRSTFYAHFRDKDALLLTSFDDVRDELGRELEAAAPGQPTDPSRPAALLFAHAHRNRRVYQALCGRQGATMVHQHLHRLIGEHLRPRLGGTELPVEVVVEFYASAALGLLVWWIDRGFRPDPARLTGMYQRLATTGLLGVANDS